MMKKTLSIIIALAMLLSCMAVPAFAATYTPGTYTGTGNGRNGAVSVEVTFTDSAIESVTIGANEETEAIAAAPFEQIPAAIVANQSLAVDAVSGATLTSNAIIEAVTDAVKQAGGDPAVMMTKPEAEAPADLGDRTANTEVLVIGGGGTGLAAAMSALNNGAKSVILVEKMGRLGGSTAVSGAVVAAQDTYYAKSVGYPTDFDAWLKEWEASSVADIDVIGVDPGYPNYDRVSKYFGEVAAAVDWLQDLGVANWVSYPFFPNIHYQVPDYIIDETGAADPEGGYMLTDHMGAWFEQNGGDIRLNTAGIKLLTNEAGDVIGATVEDKNGTYDIYAERGVVLATGGFAASQEMMDQYLPQFADWLDLTTSGAGSTGDGMKMAVEVGGVMYDTPYVITLGSTSRNPSISGFCMSVNLWNRMVVNSSAKRFYNEGYMPYQTTVELSELEDGIAWAIGDSQYYDAASLAAAVDGTEVVTGNTVEELAAAMGVDATALQESIEKYNKVTETGVDEEFGKDPSYFTAINTAPYYAVRIYVCTGGTIGGVKTNLDYQVIREDGSVIGGLYAGGEVSNREMYAYAYSSGSGVGYALASGHQIGINIMK